MKKIQDITLTREGGRFYQAMMFHWFTVIVSIVPIIVLLLISVINPFWFRTSMFNWVERSVVRLTRWRDYAKYRIYLGVDPKMWHTLRDETVGR